MQTRRTLLIAALLAFSASLGACATDTAPDRTAGQTMDDATITARVKTALANDPVVKAMDINVDTYRGVVQLNGFVDEEGQSDRAEEIARSFQVKDVKNNLEVKDKR